MPLKSYYKSSDGAFTLLLGDCRQLLSQFDFQFDMIFADPPYFLSNGGISVQSGKIVCVDKGDWDRSFGKESIDNFNYKWIADCRDKLKDNGTIWISGTYHNIFSVANQLTELGFKILNCITWVKTNPPPSNHTIFRHANFIGCLSADKIKMPVRKYFCFNIPVYRNMAEEPSCRSPYHEEYIQTSVSGNSEGLCRSTYSFLSERR